MVFVISFRTTLLRSFGQPTLSAIVPQNPPVGSFATRTYRSLGGGVWRADPSPSHLEVLYSEEHQRGGAREREDTT